MRYPEADPKWLKKREKEMSDHTGDMEDLVEDIKKSHDERVKNGEDGRVEF